MWEFAGDLSCGNKDRPSFGISNKLEGSSEGPTLIDNVWRLGHQVPLFRNQRMRFPKTDTGEPRLAAAPSRGCSDTRSGRSQARSLPPPKSGKEPLMARQLRGDKP